MKKKDLSFHVGLEGRFPHSLMNSSWMEERALFFRGTENTEQFTRKHCCITLIQAKKDKNLNIRQEFAQRYPPKAKKVEQKTRICQEKAMKDIRWNINIYAYNPIRVIHKQLQTNTRNLKWKLSSVSERIPDYYLLLFLSWRLALLSIFRFRLSISILSQISDVSLRQASRSVTISLHVPRAAPRLRMSLRMPLYLRRGRPTLL